jgi:hypothetical protein
MQLKDKDRYKDKQRDKKVKVLRNVREIALLQMRQKGMDGIIRRRKERWTKTVSR